MTDRELLELLKEVPEKGLSAVVSKYSAYVHTIAYSKLSGVCTREDIEEAVSDIFMKFYEYVRSTDREITAVAAYLAVIAKRHSINVYKKHVCREECLPLDVIGGAVADKTEESDTRRLLIEAVMSLGRPDCEIFIRKYFFGQKSRDIAEALDMKTNTVDKIVSRGLVKLRKRLNEQEGA